MKYKFHPEAENELNLSIDYYEECQVDLGYDFFHDILPPFYEFTGNNTTPF
jgi:hypothetical protein